ncbi:MAG: DUF1638 domain-containing protein [Eubacteriales bacterium]
MKIKIIACIAVKTELEDAARELRMTEGQRKDIEITFLRYDLHNYPSDLRAALQAEIEQTTGADVIVLGYGFCGNALLGLRAVHCPLVLPRVEDCWGLLMGSQKARRQGVKPGTYYLTGSWIDHGTDPLKDYRAMVHRYGEKKAMLVTRTVLRNYSNLALVDTGCYRVEEYLPYAREVADFANFKMTVIPGSKEYFQALVAGRWSEEPHRFLILTPGDEVTMADSIHSVLGGE